MPIKYPGSWESYLTYPFHIGGTPGAMRGELGFWDFLVEESEAVAAELKAYQLDSFTGHAAENLESIIRECHSPAVEALGENVRGQRSLMREYDAALAELRELMELNKEQARVHRDRWEESAQRFAACEGRAAQAAAAGDAETCRIAQEGMSIAEHEYLHHMGEFGRRFANAIALRLSVIDLDRQTAAGLGQAAEELDLLAAPTADRYGRNENLEVAEGELVAAGKNLLDEGLFLSWLPVAVCGIPEEAVDDLAGDQVVAASADAVDALMQAYEVISENVQVTGSAMVLAAANYARGDESSAAELLDVVVDAHSRGSFGGSRGLADDAQSMVAELEAVWDEGMPSAPNRFVEDLDKRASRVTSAANLVTTSAGIAEAVSAGVPVAEAVRTQAVEPMVKDTARDLAIATVNRRLGGRVAKTVATSLVKPRLVGRLGHLGVAATAAIAVADGVTAVRTVRETKERMKVWERKAEQQE